MLAKRGTQPGLVHIFSAMEPCTSYRPWHDKETGHTYLHSGKCLHYYFYFIDADLGLCYLRVPTWCPFRLQFYCNGHPAWPPTGRPDITYECPTMPFATSPTMLRPTVGGPVGCPGCAPSWMPGPAVLPGR